MAVLTLTFVNVNSTNQCNIIYLTNEKSPCEYLVVCEIYGGSAYNPTCNFEPNVTFVMKDSIAENLSAAFFGSTNFDSRVRRIRAYNNSWSTIAEGSFRYYSKTKVMDLSQNNIKSLKSMALKNLLLLEKLNLSNNHIQDLNSGSFLTSDTKESEVRELDLSHNNIDVFPPDLFNLMSNLEILYLQYNQITSLPQDLFKNLKNLTSLYLQYNNFTNLNGSLIHLNSLKYLDLSYNKLTEISGFELNRVTSLIYVNISNNLIESLESNCFNQAFNLEVVDLKNNKINSIIENVMFINNVKLRYLDFQQNCITKIQADAFKHNVLEYFSLEKNNITGEITKTTFTGLQNIKNLTISDQSITIIRDGTFSDMIALRFLNLSNNFLSTIENASFGILKNLNILDLSHNKINNLNFLKDSLTNLTELYLNDNLLSILYTNVFNNQTQLKKLDISTNKIKVIEQNSLPLQNLQFINVTKNCLTGVIKSNTLSPAQYLRYLDLSNLNISKIEEMAFVKLPVLARLNLSNNVINEIAPNNFMDTNNMYSLDISHNKLKHFEVNSSLQNLKALYVNNNDMDNLPKLNMSSVIYLDLSFNKIENITGELFEHMRSLKALHISHNKLKSFNNKFTNVLSDLTDLSLSDNEISNINLSFFRELINLDISRNKINAIDSSFLQDLDFLQYLDISSNNITKLLPGTFQNIKILKFLNMSSNSLSNLRYGSLKGLHRTEVLDISKNNIRELDVDIFHECSELKKIILDFNKIKVLDIERLLSVAPKLSSISLGGNPVSCKEIVRNIGKINLTLAFHAVELTSIDKIYHEDNVYGIKCGDNNNSTKEDSEGEPAMNKTTAEHSTLSIVIIFFLVIILIILILSIAYFYFRHNFSSQLFTESRLQMRRSLELNGSDFQSDLISCN